MSTYAEMITLAGIVSRHTGMSAIRSGFTCCQYFDRARREVVGSSQAGCPAFWSIASDGAGEAPVRCGMLDALMLSTNMTPFDIRSVVMTLP